MLEGRKPKNSLLAEQTKTLPPLEMGNRDKFDEGIEQKVNFFGLRPSKIIKIFACGAKNENFLLHSFQNSQNFRLRREINWSVNRDFHFGPKSRI